MRTERSISRPEDPRPAPLYPGPARVRRLAARHARNRIVPPVEMDAVAEAAVGHHDTAEHARLAEGGGTGGAWRRWGPYLAERQWGLVREDYSADGDAWASLPFDAARSTAYRWGEDGLAGLSDERQLACFAFAFWNGVDPILKERLFGLANAEGNHGEDVKEEYAYLDATPTASWLRWAYRYPTAPFPYEDLRAENARRGRDEPEYELADTGALDGCWEIEVDVAKASPTDLLIRLRATNTSAAPATLHVLPHLWSRNTWTWPGDPSRKPRLSVDPQSGGILLDHPELGRRRLVSSDVDAVPLFCENETNTKLRFAATDSPDYPKDGIGDHVVHGLPTVNPAQVGTRATLWSQRTADAGETVELRFRLGRPLDPTDLTEGFDDLLVRRRAEADDFHATLLAADATDPEKAVVRQALAGLVWSKVFYHYDVSRWLDGDAAEPSPPSERLQGRNSRWRTMRTSEVLLMPDAWEYPWFASWDLAFHTVALAPADPYLACEQLLMLTREWYSRPDGQLPAYEWSFDDVNPPVQAWAALRVARSLPPDAAHEFLERVFHKQVMHFTWWVNRIDSEGDNVFAGGFLGMDNVGPFDRTHQPPGIGRLEQSDGTAWTAMFCLDLLEMALMLALRDRAYEDMAVKFFEHFTLVSSAIEMLWDDEDGFFYDLLLRPDGTRVPMKVRSVAGLVSIAATRVVSEETLRRLPVFAERMRWVLGNQESQSRCVHPVVSRGRTTGEYLLSVLAPDRLRRVLSRVLDEGEFLSPHGLRSLSKWHREHPFVVPLDGPSGEQLFPPVDYEPAESRTGLYGGNSNWRGPVWMPLNLLVISGLHRAAAALGDTYAVELPTGSGKRVDLDGVADELTRRVVSLFVPDATSGLVPAAGPRPWPPGWVLFPEYFDGDTGAGLGASHQTGWTATVGALVARNAMR